MITKTIQTIFFLGLILFVFGFQIQSSAQGIYTAREYWEETNKQTYKTIKLKQAVGDSISDEEISYVLDFEDYLYSYFSKLSETEKTLYQTMKNQWDRELNAPKRMETQSEEFEWRGRDRAVSVGYGLYYGASLVSLFEIDNAGILGIPLITGGLWALGPIINSKKYENIDRSVIRASNAGKFLGLIYGGSLGLVVAGGNPPNNEGKAAFIMSSIGSITLGEVAFQMQKNRRYSDGHIEIMRHHGVLGAFSGLSIAAAADGDTGRPFGIASVLGTTAGLALGNMASKKYPYTRGDSRYATNMSSIGVGIGFLISTQIAQNGGDQVLLLVPAGMGILGTYLGQRNTQGVNLTARQGSTINYASGGAALLGLGISALAETESTIMVLGLASGFALITQQYLFAKYKKENLNFNLARKNAEGDVKYALKFNPENYLLNQTLQSKATIMSSYSQLSTPIINFNLNF